MKKISIFACFLFSGCSNNNDLTLNIRNEVITISKSESYKIIDLSKLTDFKWDTVYFFRGEEGGEYINSKIGFKWNGPSVPNLHRRLLFISNKEVVSYADFNEEQSLFGVPAAPIWLYLCPKKGYGVPRSDAKFAVFRSCQGGFINYPFIPMSCLNEVKSYRELLATSCSGTE